MDDGAYSVEKTEKNTRTKYLQIHFGFGDIFCARDGTRKGGTSPQTGAKSILWSDIVENSGAILRLTILFVSLV